MKKDQKEKKFVKIELNEGGINYLIVNLLSGKVVESGEDESEQGTFEDTYVDVKTINVGQAPTVSFNFGIYTKKYPNREPVWTELIYKISSKEEVNINLEENPEDYEQGN